MWKICVTIDNSDAVSLYVHVAALAKHNFDMLKYAHENKEQVCGQKQKTSH